MKNITPIIPLTPQEARAAFSKKKGRTFTQVEIAIKAGISPSTVENSEQRKEWPRNKVVCAAYRKALGLS